jgi:hypothetical protein
VRVFHGPLRKALLIAPGIQPSEVHSLLQSAFGLSTPIAGLYDDSKFVVYPLSTVCTAPAEFTGKYSLILKGQATPAPTIRASSRPISAPAAARGSSAAAAVSVADRKAVPPPREAWGAASNGAVSSSSAAAAAAGSAFVRPSDLAELEALQRRTGCTFLHSHLCAGHGTESVFRSAIGVCLIGLCPVSALEPWQVFEIFRSTADREGRMDYRRFEVVFSTVFAPAAGLDSEAARAEVKALLSRMFALFDSNGDGRVSFREFASGLSLLCRGDRDDKIKRTHASPQTRVLCCAPPLCPQC